MTTELVQLNLPQILYQRVLGAAQQSQRDVQELLLDAITLMFSGTPQSSSAALDAELHQHAIDESMISPSPFFAHPQQAEMEAEVATFESMHDQLWATYPNQYIAMHQGSVVDHDDDESYLVERIDKIYPDDVVLIRQVQETLPDVLVVRSPRFMTPS